MFLAKIPIRHHAATGLVLASLLLSFTEARAAVDLTGTWYRSPEESDDAEAKLSAAAKAMFDKATRGGRNIPSEEIPQIQNRLQFIISSYVQFAGVLEIEQTTTELHIDDGEERVRIFYVDGKKHTRQTPQGTKLETVCTGEENRVTIEQKLDRGGKIIETYVPSSDGTRMVLTVRFENKQLKPPLILRNVYDREQ